MCTSLHNKNLHTSLAPIFYFGMYNYVFIFLHVVIAVCIPMEKPWEREKCDSGDVYIVSFQSPIVGVLSLYSAKNMILSDTWS